MNTDDVYMKTIHVPIIVETDEDGIFIVSCPQFKGCHTFGKTIDEALARIREAIELCMEDSQPEHYNTFVGFREVEIVPGCVMLPVIRGKDASISGRLMFPGCE